MKRASGRLRSALAIVATVVVPFLAGGCTVMGYRIRSPLVKAQDARIGPGKMTADAIQSEVMSFADTFTSSIAQRWNDASAVRPPESGDGAVEDAAPIDPERAKRAAHERKLASISSALSIASSPNPVVAVADMVTLVTLERMRLEEPDTQEIFGAEATEKLLVAYREHEAAIWRIATRTFTTEQQEELRGLIERWRSEHPDQRYVSQVRLEDFAAARQLQMTSDPEKSGSLLSLVMLDPLAGLDPAKREVQESRMLAARAFFHLTRMPTILKWQAESFYQGLFRTEQVRDTLAATERVSLAAERISKAVETLPEEISAERKQTLEQFFAGVAEQRRALIEELDGDHSELRGTLTEFRDTVDATNDLAGSVTGAARAIESVAQRVMPDGAASEPKPGGGGLAKYEAVVAQTESAAERLNVLAQSIERLFLVPADPTGGPPPAQSAIAQAQHGAADVIDRAFWRVLVLVVVAPLAVLIAALAYRAFTRRALVLEQPRPASSARR